MEAKSPDDGQAGKPPQETVMRGAWEPQGQLAEARAPETVNRLTQIDDPTEALGGER